MTGGASRWAAACVLVLAGRPAVAAAQDRPTSPVLLAMRQELARSLDVLRRQPTPAYFLSYGITEEHKVAVRGAFGTLTSDQEERQRTLDIDVRVGSPAFDNTHGHRDGMMGFEFGEDGPSVTVPIEDNLGAIRHLLWYQTDRRYKRAVEQYARARSAAQVRVAPDDSSPDFSNEPAEHHSDLLAPVVVDHAAWDDKIRRYTAPFARAGDVYDGDAMLSVDADTRWYVNSDGSTLQTTSTHYRLILTAFAKADDGMVLPRYESYVASTLAELPSDAVVLAAVDKMIADLHALKHAPVVGAVTAPAILSGRASGVFFHEVFGHRVEGHRLKDENEGQTFKDKVGEQVLPPAFSVYFDPTQRRLGAIDLAGSYLYDDEGVKARRVDVVHNGVFEGFLMSRSPIAGFSHSNGHGRASHGLPPVARQSNLVVSTAEPLSRADLKQRLLALIAQQHKPFGFIFDDIEGGFTLTQRMIPNAFNVIPVMVYRVFPDGREELIRGVDLIGTPLTVFSKVVAADDDVQVFNGVCGAESGWVPVSAASPDVLISQIEVQKKEKSQEQAPLLPPPEADHS